MSAAVHNAHSSDHLAKRIRLPVYSCIFLPLCPFQGSSKHNEVLDSKCQTCNLLLVSSFVVRVCLPSAVFFFFFVRKQAAPLCCLYQRFSGTTNGAATRAARPSTRPTGKLWIGWSCSAGFLTTRQPVMQHWRLEFSRGCCFTSGQGRIDLRFRRSMLSVQVLRGSSREGSKGSQ